MTSIEKIQILTGELVLLPFEIQVEAPANSIVALETPRFSNSPHIRSHSLEVLHEIMHLEPLYSNRISTSIYSNKFGLSLLQYFG